MRSRKKSKETSKQMKMRNTTVQNLWDTGRAILRGKFIALEAYLKKKKREREREKKGQAQINNLTLCLKNLEKVQQTKPNVSGRKEMINIRVEINERV